MYHTPIQKRVLTVEDISCFGKCSTTVALPILSAMGHETVILPTAVLSTHTGGFTGYTVRDLTDDIRPISEHWKKTGIGFDCIYTGYLCKGRQVSLVSEMIDRVSDENTLLVVDPAMADNGKFYWGFDADHAADMMKLSKKSAIATPNVTEACFMLGEEYPENGYDRAYIDGLIERLVKAGCRSLVLTSVHCGGKYGVVGYDADENRVFSYFHERIDAPIHGTGDVFTSVMVGYVLSGKPLEESARLAADYVRETVKVTYPYLAEHPYGLLFEKTIGRLIPKDGE